MTPAHGCQQGSATKNEDGQTERDARKSFDLQPGISYGVPKDPGNQG